MFLFHLSQSADGLTVACSSPGEIRAVASKEKGSAYSSCVRRATVLVNSGDGKIEGMAMLHGPPSGNLGLAVIDTKPLNGVYFDGTLSFSPLLRSIFAQGCALFDTLVFAGETGGFGFLVFRRPH